MLGQCIVDGQLERDVAAVQQFVCGQGIPNGPNRTGQAQPQALLMPFFQEVVDGGTGRCIQVGYGVGLKHHKAKVRASVVDQGGQGASEMPLIGEI